MPHYRRKKLNPKQKEIVAYYKAERESKLASNPKQREEARKRMLDIQSKLDKM